MNNTLNDLIATNTGPSVTAVRSMQDQTASSNLNSRSFTTHHSRDEAQDYLLSTIESFPTNRNLSLYQDLVKTKEALIQAHKAQIGVLEAQIGVLEAQNQTNCETIQTQERRIQIITRENETLRRGLGMTPILIDYRPPAPGITPAHRTDENPSADSQPFEIDLPAMKSNEVAITPRSGEHTNPRQETASATNQVDSSHVPRSSGARAIEATDERDANPLVQQCIEMARKTTGQQSRAPKTKSSALLTSALCRPMIPSRPLQLNRLAREQTTLSRPEPLQTASGSAVSRLSDGSYVFVLSHLLEDPNSSKCDRSVQILDDKGLPFVLTTNEGGIPAAGMMNMALDCSSTRGHYVGSFAFGEKNGPFVDIKKYPLNSTNGTSPQSIRIDNEWMHKQSAQQLTQRNKMSKTKGSVTLKLTGVSSGKSIDVTRPTMVAIEDEYNLKNPNLRVWFTDESAPLQQPASGTNSLSAEPSGDQPLNSAPSTPQSFELSFGDDGSLIKQFSLPVKTAPATLASGDVWLEMTLVANGSPSTRYYFATADDKQPNQRHVPVTLENIEVPVAFGKRSSSEIMNIAQSMEVASNQHHRQSSSTATSHYDKNCTGSDLMASDPSKFSLQCQTLIREVDPSSSSAIINRVGESWIAVEFIEVDVAQQHPNNKRKSHEADLSDQLPVTKPFKTQAIGELI